ncbi:hypothetical protein [Clostridium tagluense]|uniref:hypothetical protein n=1 Tax=Clostridium tagluense TaxID=360422 RepID=UPI001C0D588C|nr:hypothetical protein [Clostridium tagluense]MBU3129077.1 hypothetical protein [Clostridium tagluense]
MIHTLQFYCQLSNASINLISDRFGETIQLIPLQIDDIFTACSTTIIKKYNQWRLYTIVDVVKLLQRSDIEESDLPEIESYLKRYTNFINGIWLNYHDLTLIRIDYRYDVIVKEIKEREILFKLYKKTLEQYGYKRKFNKKESDEEDIKYKTYDTSIYFNTLSTVTVAYDKVTQRKETSTNLESYEENVIRFEFRIMNSHLNNKKYKNKIEKTLKNYFKQELFLNYMKSNFEPLFYKGDYFKIFRADTIINNSSLKDKDKVLIRQFLIDVSENNLSQVKKIKNMNKNLKYNKYKFHKCIKMLNSLKINPILIPKNEACNSFIANPYKLGIEEVYVA